MIDMTQSSSVRYVLCLRYNMPTSKYLKCQILNFFAFSLCCLSVPTQTFHIILLGVDMFSDCQQTHLVLSVWFHQKWNLCQMATQRAVNVIASLHFLSLVVLIHGEEGITTVWSWLYSALVVGRFDISVAGPHMCAKLRCISLCIIVLNPAGVSRALSSSLPSWGVVCVKYGQTLVLMLWDVLSGNPIPVAISLNRITRSCGQFKQIQAQCLWRCGSVRYIWFLIVFFCSVALLCSAPVWHTAISCWRKKYHWQECCLSQLAELFASFSISVWKELCCEGTEIIMTPHADWRTSAINGSVSLALKA